MTLLEELIRNRNENEDLWPMAFGARTMLYHNDIGWVVVESTNPRTLLTLYTGDDKQQAMEILVNGSKN